MRNAFIRRYVNEEVSLFGIYGNLQSQRSQNKNNPIFLIRKNNQWVEPMIISPGYKKDLLKHFGDCPEIKERINSIKFNFMDIIDVAKEYNEWINRNTYDFIDLY